METALRFSGYLGAVLFGFGVLGAFIIGSFTAQPLIVLQLILGALFLLVWVVTSGLHSFSKASQVISGRRARFGYNVVLYSLVFIGLVVVGNIFVVNNDKRWDLTEQGVHSLSEKSINLVAGLKKPLRFVAIDTSRMMILGSSASPEKTRELLELYKYHNPQQVSFEVIDPRANPVEIDRLGMKQGNLLYLEYGEGAESAISRINTVDEQSITNAIIKLTKGASKKFYYIEGHGEPELASSGEEGMKSLVDALADEHITVEGLLLPQVGKIPEDAAGVMVAAPKQAFQEAEREVLIKYAQGGGRLILMNNAEDLGSDEIRTLAKAFGIEVGHDVVLDAESQLFTGGPQVFMAMSFSPHPITAKLSGRQPPVFSFASSVVAPTTKESGVTYTEILKSGRNSWAERDIARLFDKGDGKASFGPDDLKGPVPIAVAFEKKLAGDAAQDSAKVSRVLVFGDATWMRNDSLGSVGNQDLALNVVNWAVGEEGSVAIGPKRMRKSDAIISQTNYDAILALSFLGPELLLLLGLFVWWKRQTSYV